MPKQVTAFYVHDGKGEVITCTDDLPTIYKLLKCTCIDTPTRRVGRRNYIFIVDDEALLKDPRPQASCVDIERLEILFGNVLIVGLADDDGNVTSIDTADCLALANSMNRGLLFYSTRLAQ